MSGIGGGDTLQALLKVIGDPKTHQERLDQQEAARQAVETASSKLTKAQQQIALDKAQLNSDIAAHNTDVAAFAAEKKTILDQAKGFSDREKYLSEGEIKLANDKSEFLANSTAKTTELDQREAAVRKAEIDVNNRLTALQGSQSSLTAAQAELDQKLAAIRALAK